MILGLLLCIIDEIVQDVFTHRRQSDELRVGFVGMDIGKAKLRIGN